MMLRYSVVLLTTIGLLPVAWEADNQTLASYSPWTALEFNGKNTSYVFYNWYVEEITWDILQEGKILIYRRDGDGNVMRVTENYTYQGIIHLYTDAEKLDSLGKDSRFRYVIVPEDLPDSGRIAPMPDLDDYEKVKAMFGLPD